MNTPLISDVANGTAKLEIDWEPLRELARNTKFTTLTVPFPPRHYTTIVTNQVSGIEYPRTGNIIND